MQVLNTLIISIAMTLAATSVTKAQELSLPDVSNELQVQIDKIMIESLQQEKPLKQTTSVAKERVAYINQSHES